MRVFSPVLVAHTCNPSYSGGRESGRSQFKVSPGRPYLKKKTPQKRTGGVAQGVGSEFKPQYHQKKKKIEASLLTPTISLPVAG
jgi:hypothetical protein